MRQTLPKLCSFDVVLRTRLISILKNVDSLFVQQFPIAGQKGYPYFPKWERLQNKRL